MQKEKDKRDIELYIASTYRLNYVDYKYVLDYDSIEVQDTTADVHLRESHEVVFEATKPVVSKLANLKHIVTLHKTKTGWAILNDEYQDELSQAMAYATKDTLIERARVNHEEGSKSHTTTASIYASSTSDNVAPLSTHSYNKSAAVSYADTWWNSVNPTYHLEANDCTNYVSQAMYEGTSHVMSNPDNYSTKWYYDFYTHSGSLPWLRVDELKTFITTNSGRGPYGSSVGICSLQIGDVIQMFNTDGSGKWSHSVMLAQIIGPCSSLSYFLIDAHTTNRYHYPLSYYAAYQMRYIHITGWRD